MEQAMNNTQEKQLMSIGARAVDAYKPPSAKERVEKRAARVRRRHSFKRWYAVYLATTLLAVVAVLVLLVFGVSPDNRPLGQTLVENISDGIMRLNFPDLSAKSQTADSTTDTAPKPSQSVTDTQAPDKEVDATVRDIYYFDYSKVPEGQTPIIPMDLSLSEYGVTYINNATGYSPDLATLLDRELSLDGSSGSEPLVLIIHTHGTEAYSQKGAISHAEDGDHARSTDTTENVVSVGKIIADILNENGIPAAHCTVMHDSVQYKDSYARAEETVRRYLEEYPSIRLVIDVHRDAVIKSSGETVRPVTTVEGEAAAQVMCVVGSDWKGEDCPQWEDNLSLALKLREKLCGEKQELCRPVNLRGNTYNQELSQYSLLLEIGASGNSLEEAQTSAELVARCLSELLTEMIDD